MNTNSVDEGNPVISLHYSAATNEADRPEKSISTNQLISQIAQQHQHVPEATLTNHLAHVTLDPAIPDELYVAASKLLTFVWSTTEKT